LAAQVFPEIIKLKSMKQMLLLAAIYSLIIHQSNKKAKALPVQTNLSKGVTFKINTEKKNVPQANLIDKNAGFVSKNFFLGISEIE
jgi:hypothetical protein